MDVTKQTVNGVDVEKIIYSYEPYCIEDKCLQMMAGKKYIKLFLFNVVPDDNDHQCEDIEEFIDWE